MLGGGQLARGGCRGFLMPLCHLLQQRCSPLLPLLDLLLPRCGLALALAVLRGLALRRERRSAHTLRLLRGSALRGGLRDRLGRGLAVSGFKVSRSCAGFGSGASSMWGGALLTRLTRSLAFRAFTAARPISVAVA